jgi:hypothetical protein
MQSKAMRKAVVLASAAVLIGGLVDVAPAPAQAGSPFGGFVGGAIGGAIVGGFMSGMGRHGHPARRARGHAKATDDRDRDDADARRNTQRDRAADDRVLASLGAPSQEQQTLILKSINVDGNVGMVGTKSIGEIGVAASSEAERNYTKYIGDIISLFQQKQGRSNFTGDVTEHAIEQSLDKAFKDNKLDIFVSFIGENWSGERLKVMILRLVESQLDPLFNGNNRGNAPMQELDHLIGQSAATVYHRVFEISELLAANRSTALFAQRLYQTQGGLVDDQLRESTDRMITKAADEAAAPFALRLRRDPDGIALRYRAQRIVLDCLSENVTRITSSETGIATVGEIEQKIEKTATGQCMAWLNYQFGTDRDKLKPQRPIPLRAVWSPTGPRDDPSMYARVNGSL